MKVLILGFSKIAYMPYMHFYLEQLRKQQCEIHLLYWDRDGKADAKIPEGIKLFKFVYHMEDEIPKILKTIAFLKYRKTAKKILDAYRYDLIIVLQSLPGVLLNDVLAKKYKMRYILDYRDYTYEKISLFQKFIHKLVINSKATFVSSDAFRKYLPQVSKIYTSHNLDMTALEHRAVRKNIERRVNRIRIRFWGFPRHANINKIIINSIANDPRFELHYHGRIQNTARQLMNYCIENKVKNVVFHGWYEPYERYNFAAETDLIHNMYENDIKTVNAMGNKYYDAIALYIPQLCTKGSYMGKRVEEGQVGLALDPQSENLADQIYEYYCSINWSEFEKKCDIALSKVLHEYEAGCKIISDCLQY